MDYKYINQLLERYWVGETSLEEEEILRAFFSQLQVPKELEVYRPLFLYEQTEPKADCLPREFDERILALVGEEEARRNRRETWSQRLMPLFRAAAIVAIILTLGNAAQMPFRDKGSDVPAVSVPLAGERMEAQVSVQAEPVAVKIDSAAIDTLQAIK